VPALTLVGALLLLELQLVTVLDLVEAVEALYDAHLQPELQLLQRTVSKELAVLLLELFVRALGDILFGFLPALALLLQLLDVLHHVGLPGLEALDLQVQLKDLLLELVVFLSDLSELEAFVVDEGIDLEVDLPVDELPGVVDVLLALADLVRDELSEAALLEVFDSESGRGYAADLRWKLLAEAVRWCSLGLLGLLAAFLPNSASSWLIFCSMRMQFIWSLRLVSSGRSFLAMSFFMRSKQQSSSASSVLRSASSRVKEARRPRRCLRVALVSSCLRCWLWMERA
jgi:hypothetical protein